MTNEQQSVERLFEAALALPPEERSGFLDRACFGAPLLHHLMEQLIEADGIPDSFLRTPVLLGQGSTENSTLVRPSDGAPRFGVEEIIAERFQVVRFIARGGMGEVYEVQDRFLHGTPLALKIIRPHIAADPYSSRRFEQEVILARKVNHRNLCPIYDIFHCEEPEPPFLFLTMKLLGGESLEARLRRREAIPLEEGVQICRQLLEGIKAIHNVGIIHRDIKPNNVMLERSGHEICATIMDFGLARLNEPDASVSRTGVVAGTPGYLAPELLRGASPSNASDLYALGVVLHQVLTGHRPSPSKGGRGVVLSPELQGSRAPVALMMAITDFLSEDPELRCSAFDHVVHQDEAQLETARTPLLTRRSFAIGGVASLGLLGAGSLWKWREIDDFLHPLPVKRFVALLNWPPPSDAKVTPILLGLIDRMVNALSRAEAYDHNFYVTCQTSLTEMKTPAQVTDVCESLGANLILATSGAVTSEGISVLLQVLEAGSSKVLRSRSLHVASGEQFSLSEVATQAAAKLLNIPAPSSNGALNQIGTDNPNALAAFQAAEALMKEPNNSGLNGAIEKFKLAVELDSHFANAHARLAFAYHSLFWAQHDPASQMLARANAETALTLDPASTEGHSALATAYQDTGDSQGALREYAKALSLDPSNSLVIVRQAQIYFFLNRWQEAEQAYKRVLKVRPNLWQAYNDLGATYSFQGKYQAALQAFRAASVSAPRNAWPVANAAQMLFLLGDLDQAEATASKSIALSPLSWAFGVRADIRRAQGKYAESVEAALKAATLDPGQDTAWLKVGDAYARMKHHDKEASESYKRALAAKAEQLQIDESQGFDWMQMALYQAKTGDKTSAATSIKKADERNAVDIYSLVFKVRVQTLLGLHAEALATLAQCWQMGATKTQIQATNDLDLLASNADSFRPAASLHLLTS